MNIADIIPDLVRLADSGNLVLFLGAGASKEAGLPMGSELADSLALEFPRCGVNNSNLFDVLNAIDETEGYNRYDLEEYLTKILQSKNPSEGHLRVPLMRWKAIFTTNYDDLIEASYRAILDRVQRLNKILSPDQVSYGSDSEKVNVYKLMGCVTTRSPNIGQMVLTTGDYNNMLRTRGRMLDVLTDHARRGAILYVGYGFGDRLAFDVMDEILRTVGARNLAWSYCFIPGISTKPDLETRLRSKKIIAIDGSFGELISALYNAATHPPAINSYAGSSVTINRGRPDTLTHDDLRRFEEYFEIVTDQAVKDARANTSFHIRDFFGGDSKNWAVYAQELDLERDISRTLKTKVGEALKARDPHKTSTMILTGPAGCGKTVVLRRLAWDLYNSSGAAIVFLREDRDWFDFKVLEQLYAKLGGSEKETNLLIIVDNAARLLPGAHRLQSYLKSRGKLATILLAVRSSELPEAVQFAGDTQFERDLSDWEKVEFSESITEAEVAQFVPYLKAKGVYPPNVIDSREFWKDYIAEKCDNTFFIALYRLVKDFQKSFESIVLSEYEQLNDLGKRMYELVCFFDQCSYPIRMEMLVRSLGGSFEEFAENLSTWLSSGLIKQVDGPLGTTCYAARHRIIAETLIKRLHSDGRIRIYQLFKDAIDIFSSSDSYELDSVRNIMARVFGPNGIEYKQRQRVTSSEVRELFEGIVNAIPYDKMVLHQYGLFELDCGNLPHAEELLISALEENSGGIGRRTERQQNILVTLGQLHWKKATEFKLAGNQSAADEEFTLADKSFLKARLGEFVNGHAYHAQAVRLYWRAKDEKLSGRNKEASHLCADALAVIDQGYQSVEGGMLRDLELLEAEILKAQGFEGKSLEKLQALLQSNSHDPKAFFLVGRVIYSFAVASERSGDVDGAGRMMNQSLSVLEKAIEKFPNDRNILSIYSKVYSKVHHDDLSGLFELLQKRYTIPEERDNLELLFQLGWIAFAVGRHRDSVSYFAELGASAPIHMKRTTIQNMLVDSSGKRVRMEGTVTAINSPIDGRLRSDLSDIEIRFSPRVQNFNAKKDDRVSFEIGFNYIGPLAMNLEKI